jgi:thiamine-monophosphate kinase
MEMFENAGRTEIGNLGEFGLIDHLTKDIELKNKTTIKGVGDDAAVIDAAGKKMLVSTDMLLEGVHFDLSYMPLKHLGYKAVVVNLSDIYAMNGRPEQITVSVGFSNRFSLEAVEELYKGIYIASEKYGVDVVGGDTSSSKQGLIISISAIGYVDEKKITYRKGAKDNDLLCVTGDLGGAYMGLNLLEREKQVYIANPNMQPDLSGWDYIVGRQLRPEAQKEFVEWLNAQGIVPTSMIDISDGLASEVYHICQHSDVGMNVYESKLPMDHQTIQMAEEFNIDPTTAALNGGEDYELLFTIPQADYEKLQKTDLISIIGHCTPKEEGIHLMTKNDNKFALKAQGWQHLSSENQKP